LTGRRWGPWRRLLARLVVLLGGVLIVLAVPLPGGGDPWLGQALQGAGVLVLVCWVGKLLYDTLFYDRGAPW